MQLLSQTQQVYNSKQYLCMIYLNIILTSYALHFHGSSSLQVFQQKFSMHFSSMPRVLHKPPGFHYPNNSWYIIQFKTILIFLQQSS